ncbi:MAG: RagB/SusD family nutrient uptake outer membrane protein [Prevotella sp.]|nr:RagB/SusD family nutrient uptake outer membrane protein [Prevotella sp.]
MNIKFLKQTTKARLLKIFTILAPLTLGGAGGGFLTSCSDIFETNSDRQIFDPALDEKTDSMFYTLGILKGLQQLGDQYVLTGEMRGDLVATNSYTETDLRRLADFTADASCKYDSAYLYYRVINNCNYYIAHRDTNLITGHRKVAIPEYAEALAVRAWAYMQLAKNYGRVPFFTEPLTSIGDADTNFPEKDLQGICDALAPQMAQYSGTPVPAYGNISAGVLNSSSSDNPVEKSVESSKAMLPIDLVLGDLYLETHQYEQAAKYYFTYIRNRQLNARLAYIAPFTWYPQTSTNRLPNDVTVQDNSTAFSWATIFNVNSPNDIVTYIPLATNQLRGITTSLPRYFGYDFYSTTGGLSNSSSRYLLERQIDASQSYLTLSNAQEWYYMPAGNTDATGTIAKTLNIGDMRRYVCLQSANKGDSLYNVMIKFTSANIPIYRTATVYLRLAEAFNRMGYPDAAFAILKDGINQQLFNFAQPGGWAAMKTDDNGTPDDTSDDMLVPGDSTRYLRPETISLLQNTFPFLNADYMDNYVSNRGIHARGANYTSGAFSPYQMKTVVSNKIAELQTVYGIVPTGTLNDTINAVEDLICDEMALELAFEGSRFGDLTRMAKHKNQAGLYGADFGTRWLAKKLAYKAAGLEERLKNEQNWYLPFK